MADALIGTLSLADFVRFQYSGKLMKMKVASPVVHSQPGSGS